jgi:O-antigen/teichoic acid export membrane protein
MLLLAALSKPLILFLLTDKWLPAVPLMRTLSISFMFYPIHAINLNLLQVKGRSDLFLRLEIIKKVLITIVLFASAPFGVLVMCYGMIFTSIIGLMINTHYTGKLIDHGFVKQMLDILPFIGISILSGITAFISTLIINNNFAQLISGGITGIIVFITLAHLLKMEELKEIKAIILKIK